MVNLVKSPVLVAGDVLRRSTRAAGNGRRSCLRSPARGSVGDSHDRNLSFRPWSGPLGQFNVPLRRPAEDRSTLGLGKIAADFPKLPWPFEEPLLSAAPLIIGRR
jgi:hypothetical protein